MKPVGEGVAIILPAYNEEKTIAATIREFHIALPGAFVVVVNNNSKDSTEVLANSCMEQLGCGGCVINERRQGKANALRRAFLEVDADAYLVADADMTYPAERALDLLSPILSGNADMVVGDRISGGEYALENKRRFHGFGNGLVQVLVNFLFSANLSDILSGYRAFSRDFVKSYPILVEGFEVETDVTLYALHHRFRIAEIPIEYKDRPAGSESKLDTVRDGARVIFAIMQIMRFYRPLRFFGVMAAIWAICGFAVAAPVISEFVQTQYITHVPLAILATGLEVVAGVFLAIGLILDSVARQASANFELGFLRSKRGRINCS